MSTLHMTSSDPEEGQNVHNHVTSSDPGEGQNVYTACDQ